MVYALDDQIPEVMFQTIFCWLLISLFSSLSKNPVSNFVQGPPRL